jgi:hypothetical protein
MPLAIWTASITLNLQLPPSHLNFIPIRLPSSHCSKCSLVIESFLTGSCASHSVLPFWDQWGQEAGLWSPGAAVLQITAHQLEPQAPNISYYVGGERTFKFISTPTGVLASQALICCWSTYSMECFDEESKNVATTDSSLDLFTTGHPKFSLSKTKVVERTWVQPPDKLGLSLYSALWAGDFYSLNLPFPHCEPGGFGMGSAGIWCLFYNNPSCSCWGGWAEGEKAKAVQTLLNRSVSNYQQAGLAAHSPLWPQSQTHAVA